jgi:hypothetical protein
MLPAGPIRNRVLHELLPEIGPLLQHFCTVVDGKLLQERDGQPAL